ncbi:glycosyltransferase family 9 protein [Mucilaginibacter xinganensis]|uniref:ADP-heptose:LPS heptosyltransferase n=1 Tax=Mucilaginibacter xinganensis TaxID=1234841 RepID=A0A223P1Z4_9SPHI|nr:glycosyltransferase family 9 protein [Mucilaginibacter xinganensis]ASU36145.1 hypothetical protein MuYL_4260 [Mucilaginibacter xinganensis]
MLIIKTDAIGDYVLFRNFIEAVKTSALYNNHKVDLLGNVLWQDLAVNYDAAFVDEFIFLKANDYYNSPLETLKLAWRLFKKNYSVVLQPTYSRTLINDSFAALTGSRQIIGFEGDSVSIPTRYKNKTDKFYKERLILPQSIRFEFDRSKFFFESVLGEVISIKILSIPTEKNANNGIVIFPGAGIFKRSWQKERFLALIKRIKQHTDAQIYLAGGHGDVGTGNFIEENLPEQGINNLIGKTSLPQLIDLIGGAALVIANETSAVHIAVATKTPSVCILGGGHFERFAPYPAYFETGPVCVYQKMECFYCNWNCIYLTTETEPYPCIEKVSFENVWQAILPLIQQYGN